MLAKIQSGVVVGLTTIGITVEVDIASQGLPNFTIVGLPDKAVEESRERVRAAIKNSGAEFPAKRITVNLAPADIPKAGPMYDLPIALGILIASEQFIPQKEKNALYLGELSLDGGVKHTNGVLPLTLFAKDEGISSVFVPAVDANEAAVIKGITVYPVHSLISLFHHMNGLSEITPIPHISFSQMNTSQHFEFDMSDIQGQEQVKRVLEIAAAGGHNLFMKGPPGAGKTLLARTLPSILPSLTEGEALEVTKIYSVTGNLPQGESIMKYRPFRSPHHTTSRIGLIGGSAHLSPGEISLAHRGVLFLDEFPEFPRHVLEALRQPMEDGIVTISRAAGAVTYPSKFMLVGAANPCPCGNYGSQTKQCTCLPGMVSRYRKRISGPLLDRIDLHVHVPAVQPEKLTMNSQKGESSESVRKRVQKARILQGKRFVKIGIPSNAEMSNKMVKEFCPLSDETTNFLRQAISQFSLSARGYYRMIKVGRTIADLTGEVDIATCHIAEALQYRPIEE
ncbi:MAG: Mg chelatase, subunit ChlI, magnesium chelatase family protein [Microgenomates group bacterium GW2011_GWC1_43_11]|uniref:Mg chelatase, subunit ChlI n=2 Tax=Candidatus Gottesmaniibacteriota TaxID=1752720 RepID=A0A0G1GUF3_9BACT|nr:MAG: Mg chelatase, subunit ChlI, magnesium chelatase family protein [Microgenomates group bacterium GW2011_GWC1_43_11]KKT38706.1 MAG: Mg chelatase, subunit ChlI [Candidatus Gottesmanbacteria bacterium GW2011_GWB1_44_11c]HCM82609.1 magnesium chelatase [Patescibacteria group bacterium]